MKLTIEVPQIEPQPKGELTPEQGKKVIEAIVAQFYNEGIFSEKQACDITGQTRREFEEALGDYGYGVLRYTPENLAIELKQKLL
jgi:hypothetical protein